MFAASAPGLLGRRHRAPRTSWVELNLPEFEFLARGVAYRVVYDQA